MRTSGSRLAKYLVPEETAAQLQAGMKHIHIADSAPMQSTVKKKRRCLFKCMNEHAAFDQSRVEEITNWSVRPDWFVYGLICWKSLQEFIESSDLKT